MNTFKIKQYIKCLLFDDNRKVVKEKLKKEGKKLILIGQPVHSNLGDYAIVNAELDYIKDIKQDADVIVISMPFYHAHQEYLKKNVGKEDIIMISGGGWMGDLWPINELVIQDVVNSFKNNPIIIFPQTVFFEKKEALFKTAIEIYSSHDRLYIFARDQRSYRVFIDELGLPENRCYLVPDIVYSLKHELKQNISRRNVCFCLRNDLEKTSKAEEIEKIKSFFVDKGYDIHYTDTVLKKRNDKVSINKANVYKKIDEFSTYKFIVTDRLHGMLFSLLSKTPCLVFDNKTKKVSESSKWVKDLNSVMIIDGQVVVSEIEDFVNRSFEYYDIQLLQDKYEPLKKVLEKYIVGEENGKNI